MSRPPGRRGAGGRGPTRGGGRARGPRGGGTKKSCPLSFLGLPAGLARGLLAAWHLRAMGGAR